MVLCGAKPVYVNPDVDQRLGISLGMKREDVIQAIEKEIQGTDCTFTAFVVEAVRVALDNLQEEEEKESEHRVL